MHCHTLCFGFEEVNVNSMVVASAVREGFHKDVEFP